MQTVQPLQNQLPNSNTFHQHALKQISRYEIYHIGLINKCVKVVRIIHSWLDSFPQLFECDNLTSVLRSRSGDCLESAAASPERETRPPKKAPDPNDIYKKLRKVRHGAMLSVSNFERTLSSNGAFFFFFWSSANNMVRLCTVVTLPEKR